MRNEIEGKYVMQEFSHAFQFYSNSKPLLSNYDRTLIAKTDIKKLYKKTEAYAILKSFKGGKTNYPYSEKKYGDDVYCNTLNFTFIEKYKLRFYDYYLLKYKKQTK